MSKKTLKLALIVLALAGTAPLLGACHTVAGAGEDVSKTGQAVTNTADQATP
jgi:predicted small secreted protein